MLQKCLQAIVFATTGSTEKSTSAAWFGVQWTALFMCFDFCNCSDLQKSVSEKSFKLLKLISFTHHLTATFLKDTLELKFTEQFD